MCVFGWVVVVVEVVLGDGFEFNFFFENRFKSKK